MHKSVNSENSTFESMLPRHKRHKSRDGPWRHDPRIASIPPSHMHFAGAVGHVGARDQSQ